jgi:predicted Zn finger-like uncharacterized protein
VFRLTAGSLRAAGGQVRCGRCGAVFSALERLAEHARDFPKRESPRDLEARADAILQAEPVSPGAADAPPADADTDAPQDGEIAHLELDDASMEFTLPPAELDRVFVETAPGPLQLLVAAAPAAPVPDATPIPGDDPMPGDDPVPDDPEAESQFSGFRISEDARREMPAHHAPDSPPLAAPRRRWSRAMWGLAAVVLALLLALQVARTNGEWLAAHVPLGRAAAEPAGTLSAYRLRQWGVAGDPEANGTLRVRAALVNVAAQPQPYPLLRVTLADRFGARVGRREFTATEYLGKNAAHMLAPGEKVDAVLDIIDPGKDAEGFELDVCVRGAGRKLACTGDAAQTP